MTGLLAVLILCLLCACIFEFINGFHDTANAVATVIYTHTLKPWHAVVWSGICNFAGVFAGGISVAIGIISLLPTEIVTDQSVGHSVAVVIAILLTSIIWNLGTWYYGIPASSSHTLIGSLLGVGLAYSLLPGHEGISVKWEKAQEIGLSLLISPIFGFAFAAFLMLGMVAVLKKKNPIFQTPPKKKKPPLPIRILLIVTCSLVSFFHGSNDGQKGVGLVMLILISLMPFYFSINQQANLPDYKDKIVAFDANWTQVWAQRDSAAFSKSDSSYYNDVKHGVEYLKTQLQVSTVERIPESETPKIRKTLLKLKKQMKDLDKYKHLNLSTNQKKDIEANGKFMLGLTEYAPFWVIVMIAVSIGLGTMVGWRRIVVTIGEKIGKEHLTYAQGGSAELVAASTIGISTWLGLPVSTTHVLSSGVAGTMAANKGFGNINLKTMRNILSAWILTLPITIVLSGVIYLILQKALG